MPLLPLLANTPGLLQPAIIDIPGCAEVDFRTALVSPTLRTAGVTAVTRSGTISPGLRTASVDEELRSASVGAEVDRCP